MSMHIYLFEVLFLSKNLRILTFSGDNLERSSEVKELSIEDIILMILFSKEDLKFCILKGGPKFRPFLVNGLFWWQNYIRLIDQIMRFCRGEDMGGGAIRPG